MSITEEYVGKSGVKYIFEYQDADSFDNLEKEKCKQAYAVCFCDDKMVVGYGGEKQDWGLIGGTIEEGETFEEALKREIQEEANVELIWCRPLGFQKVTDTRDGKIIYQLRYVCTARPYGPFVSDPAGAITEVKFIDPVEYKNYFDWGKIGERIMERAMELARRNNI
jgi:8-oxo-dGTP pyrophosphatase MutT (NUDIX family)